MYALLGHKEPWVPKWQIRGVEENLLRAFLHHIPDGVYFKDCESRFVLISRSLAIRFGLSDPPRQSTKQILTCSAKRMRNRHLLTSKKSSAPGSQSSKLRREKHGRTDARLGCLLPNCR